MTDHHAAADSLEDQRDRCLAREYLSGADAAARCRNIVCLIDANVDAYFSGAISHADFSAEQKRLWNRARAHGVSDLVAATYNDRLNGRTA